MTTIPPITEPLGRYWDQPLVSDILVDDHHAVMTRETLEKLKDYSLSNPTGAYEGKMWRRNMWKSTEDGRHQYTEKWWLCWYGFSFSGEPGHVSNNYREILLID